MLAVTSVALLSLVSACGGKDEPSAVDAAADAVAPTSPAPETPDSVAETPSAVTEPADAGTTAPVAGGPDSCTVNVTGDVSASWVSPGGYSAVGYGAWIPSTPGVSSPIALDDTFFILNCTGPGDSYIGFGPSVGASVPLGPAIYPLLPADNVLGGSATPSVMQVLIGLDGTNTNWGPSAEGTLVITAFDANHIAGTFTIPVTDMLAEFSDNPQGDAIITGEFDYVNPH